MSSSILSFIRGAIFVLIVFAGLLAPGMVRAVSPQAANALQYLRQKMDQYINFGVYADQYSVSNHFEPTGWMGDAVIPGVVTFDPSFTDTWHTGGNSIRITYTGAGNQGWAGIYWQHPANNWGTDPNGGFNLTSAKKLTFWARGQYGGEKAEFKMGGIKTDNNRPYGDTVQPALSTGLVTLTTTWKQYTINLAGKNLSRVVGGFVWVARSIDNPRGATIYLDDIRYEGFSNKLRLSESYTNLSDFVPPRPMDTHKYLYVYLDYDSPYTSFFNNGFYESGWMGDWGDLSVNMNETVIKHSGTSAMRWSYSGATTQGQQWAGVYWQAPAYFWGDRTGGYDLTGAARLTFWARGAVGGEKVQFMLGGITGPYNDSMQPAQKTGVLSLTTDWTQYTIDLAGASLARIGGGFGWTIEKALNPGGATFYIDDVRYENAASPAGDVYQITRDTFPTDAYSMMAAHTYDNALMLLSFLSAGVSTDAARAKLLADSLVWAQQHDEFEDGRIRNVYYPDDLAIGTTFGSNGKVARHNYDKYGNGAGPGNMGWAIIALLNYYKKYGGNQYIDAAFSMGQWIYDNCYDTQGAGGYTAGYNGWPPSGADVLTYKSTEHNIDVYVAFMKLYEVTGDSVWKQRAMHAKAFVSSMWNDADAYFYTGTKADGVTLNTDNYPIDVMPWGFLAMGEVDKYGRGLASAFTRHSAAETVGGHIFEGVDFNTDKDGVWLEGTAHVVSGWWPLYYLSSGSTRSNAYASAIKYRNELRKAQIYAPRNDGRGIVATLHDMVTTGFDLPTGGPWYYYNRLHVGATAWFIISEQQWNPYWGITANQVIPYQYDYSGCPALSTPSLVSPFNGATGVSAIPTLDWSDVTGAVSYDVQVCSDSGCTSVIASGNPTTSRWTVSQALNYSTIYYWRVRAINSCDSGLWSVIRKFTTVSCPKPGTPILVSPSNGATGISLTPTLSWSNVTGATSYDIQLCSDSGCTSVLRSANVSSSQWTVSPALNYSTTYYWRVRAINVCNSGRWSAIWRFSTLVLLQPAIAVNHWPTYGSFELLTGKVTGVNSGDYNIYPYIKAQDVWWTKPTYSNPYCPINSDGTFSCNLTTGGYDQYATQFLLFMAPKNISPTQCGPCSVKPDIPESVASAFNDRTPVPRIISFSGHTWEVKYRPYPAGPGPNYFDDSTDAVWVDSSGLLHLTVKYKNGIMECTEVINQISLGYGIYRYVTQGRIDQLDIYSVLGMFTWSNTDTQQNNIEFDHEVAKWGNSSIQGNAQEVVQPCSQCPGCSGCSRYTISLSSPNDYVTFFFVWSPGKAEFRTYKGRHLNDTPPASDLISGSIFVRTDGIATPGDETPRINLWRYNSTPLTSGISQEVVISDFGFQPGVMTWDDTPPSNPQIIFTFVPPYNSFLSLEGQVTGADVSKYAVAVYIYVNGGWWNKPYWNAPLTPIETDGSWTCDITTGGIDQTATKIVAFIVPSTYVPPQMSGGPNLPGNLYIDSLANVEADRTPQ